MKASPLLLVMMVVSVPALPVQAAQTRNFADIAIVPYDVGTTLSFTYTFKTFQSESVSFSVTWTCGSYTNVLVYQRPPMVVPLYLKDTVTIPGGFLPSPTASVKLTATGSGFTVLRTLSLSAKARIVMNPGLFSDGSYIASGKVAAVTGDGTLLYYTEAFQFSNFSPFFETEVYHRLNLPDLSFSYTNGWTYSIGTRLDAEYYIEDPWGMFPNLPYDNVLKARHLNGQFVLTSDGRFHFSVTDRLFVDPSTLMMSLTQSPGYTGTAFLYLPKNRFIQLKHLHGRIRVPVFGLNALSIDFLFSHDAIYPFMGSCATSAFCVTTENGGLDTGNEDMTEVIIHA